MGSKLMLIPNVNVYEHFESAMCRYEFWEILDIYGLDYCSPYFDADPKLWVVGVELSEPSFLELANSESNWQLAELDKAITKLEKIFPDCWKTAKLVSCRSSYVRKNNEGV